jgi:hypothetical protein
VKPVALEKLLLRYAAQKPDAGRLLNWAQREVLQPWERKR